VNAIMMNTRQLLTLNSVREARERSARARVLQCRTILERYQQQRDDQQNELSAFHAWLPGREAELFGALSAQPVSRGALEDFQATLRLLNKHGADLALQIEDVSARINAAQAQLEQAQSALQVAHRAKEKLSELTMQHHQVQRDAVAKQEELVFEEAINCRSRDS